MSEELDYDLIIDLFCAMDDDTFYKLCSLRRTRLGQPAIQPIPIIPEIKIDPIEIEPWKDFEYGCAAN